MSWRSSRSVLWVAPVSLTLLFLLGSYVGVGSWEPIPKLLTLPQAPAKTMNSASKLAADRTATPGIDGAGRVLLPGSVYSWSVDGSRHALGRQLADPYVPAIVEGLPTNVISVAASGHSLAVTSDGEIWSWGRNASSGGGGYGSAPITDSGQVGARDPPDTPSDIAARVATPPGITFVAVASGRYHSLALSSDGEVWTWGLNDFGQLGRAGVDDASEAGGAPLACVHGAACRSGVPARVVGLPPIRRIAASRYASLAVTADSGRVWTWGADACGTSKDGLGGGPPATASVATLAKQRADRADQKNGAQKESEGIRAAAHAEPREISWSDLQDVLDADGGYAHWVMRDARSAVWTCDTGGDGYAGLLPNSKGGWQAINSHDELGRYEEDLLPGRVPALRAARAAAGRCFSVVARADGTVLSWGCGTAGLVPSHGPELVAGFGEGAPLGRAVELAAAEWSAVAVLKNGSIAAWGKVGGTHGTAHTPVVLAGIPPGSSVVRVSGAHQHFLAIVADTQLANVARASSDAADAREAADAATADAELTDTSGDAGSSGKEASPGVGTLRDASADSSTGTGADSAGAAEVARDMETAAAAAQGDSAEKAVVVSTPAQRAAAALSNFSPDTLEAVRQSLPDVFANLGDPLPTARNQCFRDSNNTSLVRCLPAFSILGVSKCGTTDLYHKLMAFPGFMGSKNKGPHYWDSPNTENGWEKYLSLYDEVGKLAALGQPEPLTCDASSATFSYAARGVRGVPSRAPLPLVLRVVQPTMKMIVMVRNPVDRFYSAFYYYGCSYGPQNVNYTAESFHVRATTEVDKVQKCIGEGKRPLQCVGELFHSTEQLIKGLYSVVLPDWLSTYPRTDFLLLRTESYAKQPRETILRVLDFLGADHPPEAILEEQLGKRYNEGARPNAKVIGCSGKRPPMLQKTRAFLEEFYAPYNAELARLWGDPNMTWEPTAKVEETGAETTAKAEEANVAETAVKAEVDVAEMAAKAEEGTAADTTAKTEEVTAVKTAARTEEGAVTEATVVAGSGAMP